MLVVGILQGSNEWVGELSYWYGRQRDTIAFMLSESEDKPHYLFTWDLADMLKLASAKTKEDIEVVDHLQGVTLRWDGVSDEFQIVRPEDQLDFSFTYLLPSIREWLRIAKNTMVNRDMLGGQSFSVLPISDSVLAGIGCYGAQEYLEERGGKRWVR